MNSFWVLAYIYSPFVLIAGLEVFAVKSKRLNSFGVIFIFGFYMIFIILTVPSEAADYIMQNRLFNIMEKICVILLPIITIALNIDAVVCGIKLMREGLNFRTITLILLIVFCIIVWDYMLFRFQIPELIKGLI